MELGPKARAQLALMKALWPQGDHALITGGTGSGKTVLARHLDQMRIDAGGSVVVFVGKLQPDETLEKYYSHKDGWTRWKTWKKHPRLTDRKILLWPDVDGKNYSEAGKIQKDVFQDALYSISTVGRWTTHIDEGLYMTDPSSGLGFSSDIALMYSLMRSAKATMITLAQRPSHLPLAIYANIAHAFIGQSREMADLRRLANFDASFDSRALARMIKGNGKHDFTWVPIAAGLEPMTINLAE